MFLQQASYTPSFGGLGVKLDPGAMVEARVNVHDLVQDLEAKQYSFTTVFGAVGSRSGVEPPSGMIAWWAADGSAIDLVGGNNGTMGGDAKFVEGYVGQAFSFDGAGDGVVVPHEVSLNLNHFTIDAWIWPAGAKAQTIISKGDGPMLLVGNDGKVQVSFSGTLKAVSNAQLSPDRFNHLAATFDGSKVKIYIDGRLDAEAPFIGTPAVNTQPRRDQVHRQHWPRGEDQAPDGPEPCEWTRL